jgi:hypothetical protein
VFDSRECIRLSGLPSIRGESSMSVKVPWGTMNGTSHVGKSATR